MRHASNHRSERALLGLIGAPIRHSASPAMQESAARAAGIHCFYQLIEIAGANSARLATIAQGLRDFGFAGANVTFPYKETIVEHLDDLSPAARAIGAVNAIVVRDGFLTGYNTDASGFERAVRPFVEARDGAIAVIGAGGVGKAIVFALAALNVSEISVYDSSAAKIAAIGGLAGARIKPCRSVAEALDGAVGLVNATPVGMYPDADQTPVPEEYLRRDIWVADAVYSPLWTRLLRAAKERGADVMTGRDLAVYQAADAFRLFTGVDPSIQVISAAFDEMMAERYHTTS